MDHLLLLNRFLHASIRVYAEGVMAAQFAMLCCGIAILLPALYARAHVAHEGFDAVLKQWCQRLLWTSRPQ